MTGPPNCPNLSILYGCFYGDIVSKGAVREYCREGTFEQFRWVSERLVKEGHLGCRSPYTEARSNVDELIMA